MNTRSLSRESLSRGVSLYSGGLGRGVFVQGVPVWGVSVQGGGGGGLCPRALYREIPYSEQKGSIHPRECCLVCKIWTIKLFVNRGQRRILNRKTTDLDWYYFRHHQKLKFLIHDLLFMPFVNNPWI